jgi:hypothetical protein
MKITSKFDGKCRDCGGRIAKGESCEWVRGEGIRHVGKCPPAAPQAPREVPVMMGVFRKADGRIFVVKPNKAKTKLYAKEIIESAPRMTEAGEVVDFETVYRPGAVYDLNESERWDLAEAQNFLTRYARCIVCGAHLKAAKSVAGAIGPVCAKYFKKANGAGPAPAPAPVEEFDEARAEMIANGIDPDGGPDCTTNDGPETIVIDLVAELKKRLTTPARFVAGWVVYSERRGGYVCDPSPERPVGIGDLPTARFFIDEQAASIVAFWQHGRPVPAVLTEKGIRLL